MMDVLQTASKLIWSCLIVSEGVTGYILYYIVLPSSTQTELIQSYSGFVWLPGQPGKEISNIEIILSQLRLLYQPDKIHVK